MFHAYMLLLYIDSSNKTMNFDCESIIYRVNKIEFF